MGIVINIIFYFVGYSNIYVFIIGRFLAFLPVRIWSSVTTIMFGDSVDELQFKTGKRLEGTCFSLLTFIGKFQNGVNVALTGLILSVIGYVGTLDADFQQQSEFTLKGIFAMVTLVPALGFCLWAYLLSFMISLRASIKDTDALNERNLLEENQSPVEQ